ncbi:hypothetical protein [Saccharopolyspora hattusasensis]|uniref:hypothetical protein n=1 Tax=Saccharopolyspora hattusasensis TaxID=1128679 RepID=UPI003D952FC0
MNHDDLVAKYSTPRESLPAETRQKVDDAYRTLREKQERGEVMPESIADRQDFPIGVPSPTSTQPEPHDHAHQPHTHGRHGHG